MSSRGTRIALVAVGAVALVTGAVWLGQGLNLIPGSFMTGDRTWLFIGLIVALVGLLLIVRGARPPKGRGPDA